MEYFNSEFVQHLVAGLIEILLALGALVVGISKFLGYKLKGNAFIRFEKITEREIVKRRELKKSN